MLYIIPFFVRVNQGGAGKQEPYTVDMLAQGYVQIVVIKRLDQTCMPHSFENVHYFEEERLGIGEDDPSNGEPDYDSLDPEAASLEMFDLLTYVKIQGKPLSARDVCMICFSVKGRSHG